MKQSIKERIIVVDDDLGVLTALEAELQDHYDVSAVCTAGQALALLQSMDFAAIISDVRMPVVDGLSLISQCAVRYPNMVRIILTAFDGEDVTETAMSPGAYKLLKPWGDDLVITLNTALKMRQSNLDLRRHLDLKSELLDLDRRLHTDMSPDELIGRVITEMMRIPEVSSATYYTFPIEGAPIVQRHQSIDADNEPTPLLQTLSSVIPTEDHFFFSIPIGEWSEPVAAIALKLKEAQTDTVRYLEFIARQAYRTLQLIQAKSQSGLFGSVPPPPLNGKTLGLISANWVLDKLTTPITVLSSTHHLLEKTLEKSRPKAGRESQTSEMDKSFSEVTEDLGSVAASLTRFLEHLKKITRGSSVPPPEEP